MLNRREWIEVLVRMCLMRYVQTGEEPDCSKAFDKFLGEVLARRLPRVVLQNDANEFRRRYCYTEGTDSILHRHEAMLRPLFEVWPTEARTHGARMRHACPGAARVPLPPGLTRRGGTGGCSVLLRRAAQIFCVIEKVSATDKPNPLASKEGLYYDQWMSLVDGLEWIDGAFSRRDAGNAFVWARMWAYDDGTIGTRKKAVSLFYEDFLEALVRVATMKPLPTLQEIIMAGHSDAGEFLLELRPTPDARSEAYAAFCAAHPAGWDVEPSEDAEDLVEHLCMLIIRTIEGRLVKAATKGFVPSGQLNRKDLLRFRQISTAAAAAR